MSSDFINDLDKNGVNIQIMGRNYNIFLSSVHDVINNQIYANLTTLKPGSDVSRMSRHNS